MPPNEPESYLTRLTKSRRRRIALFLLFVTLGFVGTGLAFDTLTTDPYVLTEGTTLNAHDGPEIILGDTVEIDRVYPVDSDIVNLLPLAQFTGDAGTHATVSNLDGEWVQLSGMDVSAGDLTANTTAHPEVTVTGGATSLEIRDYVVNDDNADLHLQTSGASTITVTEIPADSVLTVFDSDDTVLDVVPIDGTEATFTTDHSGALYLAVGDVLFSDPEPEDGAFVDNQTAVDLSVFIDHPSFENGNPVDVRFYDADTDELLDEDTLTEAGRAEGTWSDNLSMGANEWYVETEEGELVHTSPTWSFDTPHILEIRDEQTLELIDGDSIEVEVQFFPEDGDETVTRTTESGNVSLEGLPMSSEYIIRTDAEGWHVRETVIRDITTQQAVYLLNESEDSVQINFRIDDATGSYPEGESRILIFKSMPDGEGGTAYQNIVGQEFGVGGATTWLEADQRYRIEVENADGDRRSLGSFTPSIAETITLTIQSREVSIAPPDHELGFRWDVAFDHDAGEHGAVEVTYQDGRDLTDDLTITVYERGNATNVLAETTHSNLGNVTETHLVEDEYQNVSSWTIEISGTYDGEQFSASRSVDVDVHLSFPLPDRWKLAIAMGSVLLIGAALGSQARADLGAVVAALFAGFWFVIGWMPGAASGTMIVVALLTAMVYRHAIIGRGVPR